MTEETKEEKDEWEKKRENLLFVCFIAVVLAFVVGYTYGHLTGVFDGYQFALKQFNIIASIPEMIP